MRVERKSGREERKILTSMIVDKTVLSKIAARWPKEGLFDSDWSNLVGGWCVKHFAKYGKAPGGDIESRFDTWSARTDEKATVRLVGNFLSGLSGEYEQLKADLNPSYIVDLASDYFNKVRLQKLKDAIQYELDEGQPEKAQQLIDKFNKIEMGLGGGIDVLSDKQAIQDVFDERVESLMKYPGTLGDFFGDSLARDCFVALMAPEKRGKSWWLLDLAWRAMLQRRKVAYFQAGDMSQNQILRRMMTRAMRRPLRPRRYQYPTTISRDPDSFHATVDLEEREYRDEVDMEEAWLRLQEIKISKTKSKQPPLMLSPHANNSLSISGMRDILATWERQSGWMPDIIISDYADIMAKQQGMESRDGTNLIWSELRALAMEFHCLVITATQADAGSYSKQLIGLGNFSEDKRKYSHVTDMFAINSSPEEKEVGLYRLNWLVRREEAYSINKCCHVAACLELANPAIRSCF